MYGKRYVFRFFRHLFTLICYCGPEQRVTFKNLIFKSAPAEMCVKVSCFYLGNLKIHMKFIVRCYWNCLCNISLYFIWQILPLYCIWQILPSVLYLTDITLCFVFDRYCPLYCSWQILPSILYLTDTALYIVFGRYYPVYCIWQILPSVLYLTDTALCIVFDRY